MNLHNAAQEKAASKLKIANNPKAINAAIINTAISKDGSSVHNQKVLPTDSIVSKLFGKKDRKYELVVILPLDKFERLENEELTASKDVLEKVSEKNKDSVESLKKTAIDGLKEYIRWFTGEKNANIDPVVFLPAYDGSELKVKGYSIVEMDDVEMREYFENLPEDEKPKIGFKTGYTITYDKPDDKKQENITNQT